MELEMTKLILVFSLLATSAPAFSQATSTNGNTPAAKGQDLNKIVCEVQETTGTRLGARKICKTVLEWQQMRREQRETVEKFQQQNTSTGIPSG
jgi:hypothetical protein